MLSLELKEILLETRLCKYLELQEITMLLKNNQPVKFAGGDVILHQGKKSSGLYIILEGDVLVTAKILGEGATNLSMLSRGNILGEISVMERGPCATSAIACDSVTCILISSDYFDMLSVFFPETKFKFIKAITEEVCDRLMSLHKKLTQGMEQYHMVERSIFSEVIRTLNRPTEIEFDETGIDFALLKNSVLFKSFTQNELDELLKYSTAIHAPTKSTLIHEDEKHTSCYIVLRGAVQSSFIKNNIFAKLSVLGPMQIFCSISFIGCTDKSIINYTTCERAVLLKISQENLLNLEKTNTPLWYKLYELLGQSFVEVERSADKLDIRLNSETYNR